MGRLNREWTCSRFKYVPAIQKKCNKCPIHLCLNQTKCHSKYPFHELTGYLIFAIWWYWEWEVSSRFIWSFPGFMRKHQGLQSSLITCQRIYLNISYVFGSHSAISVSHRHFSYRQGARILLPSYWLRHISSNPPLFSSSPFHKLEFSKKNEEVIDFKQLGFSFNSHFGGKHSKRA